MSAELDRDDVMSIIGGVFDVNRRLGSIAQDVQAIREILEDDEEEGEAGEAD